LSGNAFSELRTYLDGSDNFVSGGHRIMRTAGATRHAARMKRVPVWVREDSEILKILLRSFPKFRTDPKQKKAATLWMGVIYQYWRVGHTRGQVAHDLGISEKKVKNIIQRINFAVKGERADGRGPLGKPKGRPKLKHEPIEAPSGTTGDSHIAL
jgi:hypothetical protein